MFYKDSCWKCIPNYSCGPFQSDKNLVGYRPGTDDSFLNALTLDSVHALPQILAATPTWHGLCPLPPLTRQVSHSSHGHKLPLTSTTNTQSDQVAPDIGLIRKEGPAKTLLPQQLLEQRGSITQKCRGSEALLEWTSPVEDMTGGSK